MTDVLTSVRLLAHPYHAINILFSLSYLGTKLNPALCALVFPEGTEPDLSMWESEVMFFLLVVVAFRTRRSGSRSLLSYTSTAAYYTKACNCILWASADPLRGVLYTLAVMVHFLLVGEPVPPRGTELVTYFEGLAPLTEALEEGGVWLIAYYTAWAPPCAQLAPVFASISRNYSLPNLRFGKVDVGRHADVAVAHSINTSGVSLQLPTVALYRDGKLLMRRPTLDKAGKFQRFYFTEDNIVAAYDLNNVYLDCKKRKKEVTRAKKD